MPRTTETYEYPATDGAAGHDSRLDQILIAAAIFLSAFLLFQVQPLMGRHILPLFGGGASVWTSCMLFFQCALLVGYAYAHLLDSFASIRAQVLVHLGLLALSLFALPVGPEVVGDAIVASPGMITILLAAWIGAPFVILAASAPLLSAWYRQVVAGGSPYRLYALSNSGSFLALLSYPFVIEPLLSLRTQSAGWSWTYVVFAALCVGCGWRFAQGGNSAGARVETAAGVAAEEPDSSATPTRIGQVALWIALAATGSMVLLATTSQLSQEVSVVPMLWVLPLAIYLLTFILCFERDGWYDRRLFVPLLLVAVSIVMLALARVRPLSYTTMLVLFSSTQFICCMCCHGELARIRPASRYLTRFYLALAAGGAFGGFLTAVVAPRVFNGYWEYPLVLIATLALVASQVVRDHHGRMPAETQRFSLRRISAPLGAIVLIVLISLPAVQAVFNWNRNAITTSRNFYGVIRIAEGEGVSGPVRDMFNGAVSHGSQLLAPGLRQIPTQYYGVRGGLGFSLQLLRKVGTGPAGDTPNQPLRIGVVGLGVGTIAALAEAGDHVRFYEINPEVERLARAHFTFLDDSPASAEVVLGDARTTLTREAEDGQPQEFDILILDAFNSDSVPVHLLTMQAYEVYRRHLKDGGVMAFHTTNRYLALSPNIRELAERHGDSAVRIVGVDEGWFKVAHSSWVITTSNQAFLKAQSLAVEATPWLPAERTARPWTDDFSSLWDALRHKQYQAPGKWIETPNYGLFVYDIAGFIDEKIEAEILQNSRALYWETNPRVPVMVVTAPSLSNLGRGQKASDAAANRLGQSLGLSQFEPQMEVLLLVIGPRKRIGISLGKGWSSREQRYLEESMHRIIRESLNTKGVSETLRLLTHKAREFVRSRQRG
jgi:spermidine synthase